MGFATTQAAIDCDFPRLPLPVLTDSLRVLRLEWVDRRGSVVSACPFAEQDNVLSLNLTQGCVHQCPFCMVRSQAGPSSPPVIRLYANTALALERELLQRRRLPRAVYISPASDPFPPHAAAQREAVQVAGVLAEHGIDAWFMTRGYIRPTILRLLAEHAAHVKVTVALTTLNRSLQRVLEPLTAPPRLRIRQMADLRAAGISVQVALEPLLPGLTDTRENLAVLLETLAGAGVTHRMPGAADE